MSADTQSRPTLSGIRSLLIVGGIVSLIVGLLIVIWPGVTAVTVTLVIAIYAIVAGLIDIGVALFGSRLRGWARVGHVIVGLLFVATGIIAFLNPALSAGLLATVVVVFIAVSWIFEGIGALATLGLAASKGWTVFFAIVSIVAGVAIIFAPIFAATFFLLWLGISLIVIGILQIVRGFTLPKA